MMLSLILSAALAFTPEDANFAFETAKAFVEECTPRDTGTIRCNIAANWLLDKASATGADVRRDAFMAPTPRGERRFVNLYAEFKGDPTNRWVVLLSHYDAKHGCPGANDGASTSGLLVSLANCLFKAKEPVGNVLLVWTDGEECLGETYSEGDGFQGSKRAVEYLQQKERKVQAVICLDMLGDKDLAISVPANGSATLSKIACHAARRIGEPKLVSLSDVTVKDDHCAFISAGYPAIDLIDFDYGPNNSWWHTEHDTCDKISADSLLKAGRLVCEMLGILL